MWIPVRLQHTKPGERGYTKSQNSSLKNFHLFYNLAHIKKLKTVIFYCCCLLLKIKLLKFQSEKLKSDKVTAHRNNFLILSDKSNLRFDLTKIWFSCCNWYIIGHIQIRPPAVLSNMSGRTRTAKCSKIHIYSNLKFNISFALRKKEMFP